MDSALLPSGELHTRATRLEKEAEFLLSLANCSKQDYKAAIESASTEQLKAILECLRNFQLFRVHLKAQAIKTINKILQVSFEDEERAKDAFVVHRPFIQATLANIFLKIILTEFHFIFCL
jgi:hypothetical protein